MLKLPIFLMGLVIGIICLSGNFIQTSSALQEEDSETECREEHILVFRINSNNYVCVSPSTAEKWVEWEIAEIVETEPATEEKMEETIDEAKEVREEAGESTFTISEYTQMPPSIDPEKGYFVTEIADRVFWLTDGIYQTIFLSTGQGVIAVDAPPSIGEKYLNAISDVTNEPVTHFIYSHSHIDHVGSADIFSDVQRIAHEETAMLLEKRNDPNRPVPSETFSDSYILEVGDKVVQLDYNGPAHEPGNIFIYIPEQRILMLVDVVFPGWTPFKNLAMAEDVSEFLKAHDQILEYEFDYFIGGHLDRLGTSDDVLVQKEYFDDMVENAVMANESVDFMEIGQRVGFDNPWLLFDTYMDEVTQLCTEKTVSQWEDRLKGVEIFSEDHCFTLSQSQRID